MSADISTPPTLEAANNLTQRTEHDLRDWLAQLPGASRDVCKTKEKELFRALVGIVDLF